ncbi:MAG: rod shape-determining protein MreC [Candidatus Paracaedibacteraceae bacterium]|nr:rod shape-determining protein MreC [Candidatus Paracaedibacteraceae bacterium]
MYLRKYRRRHSTFGRRIWPSASFFKVRLNAAKITLVFAILGALVLSFVDYRNQQFTQNIKNLVADVAVPVVGLSMDITKNVTTEIQDLIRPYKKYEKQLQEKDDAIQLWRLEVQRLRQEIKLLKEALKYKKNLPSSILTTQLIVPRGRYFSHKAFLNIGSNFGVQKNSVVISSKGIVGKVVQVSQKTSEVMLLSHPLSAIPIYLESNNESGVVKGDVKRGLVLSYTTNFENIKNGDRVLTSGQGGVYPRGINVGLIKKKNDLINVLPFHAIDNNSMLVYVIPPNLEGIPDNEIFD